MPDLLIHPSHAETIRQLRLICPLQHTLVVLTWPFQDPFAADGELSAAHVSDVFGHLLSRYAQYRLVHFREKRADVVLLDIDLCRAPGVHARGTSRIVLAPKVHITLRVDGLKSEVFQRGAGMGTEEVIMPLVEVRVDEDGILRKLVVEVDDEGKVCGSFATTDGAWNKKVGGRGLIGRVDKGN